MTAQFVGEGAARLGKQAARQARATLTLGYSRSMREIVQILSARAGADPVIRERKAAVKKETGKTGAALTLTLTTDTDH